MGWEIDGVTLEQREAVQPPPPLGEAAAAAGLIDDLQSPGSKKRHLLICKLFSPGPIAQAQRCWNRQA